MYNNNNNNNNNNNDKMGGNYYTVITLPISNIKKNERCNIDTPNTNT